MSLSLVVGTLDLADDESFAGFLGGREGGSDGKRTGFGLNQQQHVQVRHTGIRHAHHIVDVLTSIGITAVQVDVVAADKAKQWGQTSHRYWYVWHVHHVNKKEYPGGIVEYFRTLAPGDSCH